MVLQWFSNIHLFYTYTKSPQNTFPLQLVTESLKILDSGVDSCSLGAPYKPQIPMMQCNKACNNAQKEEEIMQWHNKVQFVGMTTYLASRGSIARIVISAS